MGLINCKECNNQISQEATSCPKCGSPQKKSKIWIFILILIIAVLGVGYVYISSLDDRSERIALAKEILRNNKDDIVQLTTTKVENPFAKIAIGIAADISCNCLIDSLSIKLADKHTLNELNEIKVHPVNNIKEITTLIVENEEVCVKCLTFQN